MTLRNSPRFSAVLLIALLVLVALVAGCPGSKAAKTAAGTATHSGMPQSQAESTNPPTAQSGTPAPDGQAAAPPAAPAPVELKTVEFTVAGMKDAQSASSIESALIQIDGVSTVSANDKTGSTKVQFDPAKVTTDKLIAEFKKLGFKAKLNAGA